MIVALVILPLNWTSFLILWVDIEPWGREPFTTSPFLITALEFRVPLNLEPVDVVPFIKLDEEPAGRIASTTFPSTIFP